MVAALELDDGVATGGVAAGCGGWRSWSPSVPELTIRTISMPGMISQTRSASWISSSVGCRSSTLSRALPDDRLAPRGDWAHDHRPPGQHVMVDIALARAVKDIGPVAAIDKYRGAAHGLEGLHRGVDARGCGAGRAQTVALKCPYRSGPVAVGKLSGLGAANIQRAAGLSRPAGARPFRACGSRGPFPARTGCRGRRRNGPGRRETNPAWRPLRRWRAFCGLRGRICRRLGYRAGDDSLSARCRWRASAEKSRRPEFTARRGGTGRRRQRWWRTGGPRLPARAATVDGAGPGPVNCVPCARAQALARGASRPVVAGRCCRPPGAAAS